QIPLVGVNASALSLRRCIGNMGWFLMQPGGNGIYLIRVCREANPLAGGGARAYLLAAKLSLHPTAYLSARGIVPAGAADATQKEVVFWCRKHINRGEPGCFM